MLAGAQRSEEHRARDRYRHPKETLLFFGLRPEMTVVELWPGADGWYTEILAPLLREHGRFYAAQWPPSPDSSYITTGLARFRDKLASDPGSYDRVIITTLGDSVNEIAPAGSADMVLTFRNLHSWMGRGELDAVVAAAFRALKPGGIFGVVEHRGNDGQPQDPKARSGYVNETFAVERIEAGGFRLVAKSAINANGADTKDYEAGVWALPPTLRMGQADRERMLKIGESDRFTLRFVKPEK